MTLRCVLDFGTRYVNALEGSPGCVLRYGTEPLDERVIWEGVPQAGLADAIRRLRTRTEMKASISRLVIAEVGTTRRQAEVPRIPTRDLEAVVGHLARRIIPMDPEQVYYAWDLEPLSGRRALLTVQAAWRDAIDGYQRACQSAGLQVEWIDLKPVALARALRAADALAAEWAPGELSVTMIRDGRPVTGHTELVASGRPGSDTFETAAKAFDAALASLRRTYRELALVAPLPLFLCGGFAQVPDLAQRARERFPFPLAGVPPPREAPPGFLPASFAAALGMMVWPRQLRPRLTLQQVGDKRVA